MDLYFASLPLTSASGVMVLGTLCHLVLLQLYFPLVGPSPHFENYDNRAVIF